MIEEKKKIEYVDVARGIAILLMIIGHSIEIKTPLYNIIYSFHMPLFIFTSGMFFKERDFKSFIKNLLKKILLPYMLVTFCVGICEHKSFLDSLKRTLTPSGTALDVLWFMPFLAIIKTIFYMLKKISRGKDFLLYVLCFSCLIFSYGLSKFKTYDIVLDVSLFAVIYYFFGYIFMKHKVIDKILDNRKIMIGMLVVWSLGANIFRDLALREYADGYITILVAICGSFLTLKLSKIILDKFNNLGKILIWYGNNSLYVLLFHYIERRLVPYDLILESRFPIDKAVIYTMKLVIITVGVVIKDLLSVIYRKLKLKKRKYK